MWIAGLSSKIKVVYKSVSKLPISVLEALDVVGGFITLYGAQFPNDDCDPREDFQKSSETNFGA